MMLTRCKKCGIEAHYRFEYILHKLKIGESVCRACYWKQWYRDSWTKYGVGQGVKGEIPESVLLDVIGACGYEFIDVIPGDRRGEELALLLMRANRRRTSGRHCMGVHLLQDHAPTVRVVLEEARQVREPGVGRWRPFVWLWHKLEESAFGISSKRLV